MKKARAKGPDILPEYDFSSGTRGKYAEQFAEGSNVVVIDSDLAGRFGDSAAVNEALRGLVELADRRVKGASRAPRQRRTNVSR